jgi:hypothetical protein
VILTITIVTEKIENTAFRMLPVEKRTITKANATATKIPWIAFLTIIISVGI